MVSLNDALDAVTAGTVFTADLGVDVVEGWNTVGVAINYDNTVGAERTLATGFVVNEDNTAIQASPAAVPVLDIATTTTNLA